MFLSTSLYVDKCIDVKITLSYLASSSCRVSDSSLENYKKKEQKRKKINKIQRKKENN